jgi:hypothetical protein
LQFYVHYTNLAERWIKYYYVVNNMKMKLNPIHVIILISALLLLNSCEPETQNTQSKEKVVKTWSAIPGDPNFSMADRLAIKDVMNAYSLYWDNSDLESFFELFTDQAVIIVSNEGQEDVLISVQERKEIASERLDYFKSKGLQRRHLMANTHFLQQNDSSAYIKQYTLLTSTENEKELKPISTIVYDVWLKKVDGIWKISKYEIGFDGELDVSFKSNSNSEEE